uniref:Anaphase-promoting complex subunit 4 WD40 domain-containing protein n=1 Tax=Spongospora subterranea TaxID=70186 RepID=A0A0H5QK90_9EUKA|eukprot:CRZ01730.1 hypothetical protein [Spongospora subterranea]
MLAVGWKHAWSQQPGHLSAIACCSSIVSGDGAAHISAVVTVDTDPTNPSLIITLYTGRLRVGKTVVRPELGSRFGQPSYICLYADASGKLYTALLWSNLGVSMFDVDINSLVCPFQESSCFQLPPAAQRITAYTIVGSRLVIATQDSSLWVFDWSHPATSVTTEGNTHKQGRKARLPWADEEVALSIHYNPRASCFAVTTIDDSLIVCIIKDDLIPSWLDHATTHLNLRSYRPSCSEGVSCVAVSSHELMVGHVDGSLSYYPISLIESSSQIIPIPVGEWRNDQHNTGPVSHLTFSCDESILCVAWSCGNIALLSSLTFTCLYCTLPEHPAAPIPTVSLMMYM